MKNFAKIIGGLLIVGLILAILIPSGGGSQSAYQAAVRSNMKHICFAVNDYYQRSGRIPKVLSEIPEQILEKEFLYFYDPESQRPYDWLYFCRELQKTETKHTAVLIVAPTMFGTDDEVPANTEENFRFVGFMDGHVERMTQSEFEALMVDQDGGINSVPLRSTP